MTPLLAYAGAWNMPSGHGQIISTTLYDTAGRAYDDRRNLQDGVAFQKVESAVYIEHGLTPKITLIASSAYQTITFANESMVDEFSGFGDTGLGLRYNLWKGEKSVFALQPSLIISGRGENTSGSALGAGRDSLEIRGLVGRSGQLWERSIFLEGQIGTRIVSSGRISDWHMDATVGVNLTPSLQLIGQSFFTKTEEQNFVLPNQSLKAQASLIYRLGERHSVQFGAFQTVMGKNIIQERAVLFSLWRRY